MLLSPAHASKRFYHFLKLFASIKNNQSSLHGSRFLHFSLNRLVSAPSCLPERRSQRHVAPEAAGNTLLASCSMSVHLPIPDVKCGCLLLRLVLSINTVFSPLLRNPLCGPHVLNS